MLKLSFLKLSHILPRFNISYEITIETPLTSKKCRLAKFCKVETSFSSRFFFNISEISANIKKPTKYQSTFINASKRLEILLLIAIKKSIVAELDKNNLTDTYSKSFLKLSMYLIPQFYNYSSIFFQIKNKRSKCDYDFLSNTITQFLENLPF